MTNTERLEACVVESEKFADGQVHFYVGKYTGNNPSVLNALRRRGYVVSHAAKGGYIVSRK